MDRINEALKFAQEKHLGQKDLEGKPYILHPMRVASNFFDEHEIIVALLHDVVEDTHTDIVEIEEKFGEDVAEDLWHVTKEKGESYEEYIENKVAKNKVAIKIKKADLRDNMNLNRIVAKSEKDLRRIRKYKKAYKFLNSLS